MLTRHSGSCCIAAVVFVGAIAATVQAQWTQWGGAERNFVGAAENLANKWPAEGPPVLWKRELGAGYSGVLCDGDLLFTMYRKGITEETEYVIALNARTGETVWEYANKAPIKEPPDQRWGGQGPNSTPLVAGDRVFAVGSRCMLLCLDKKSGKLLWGHDLEKEYGAGTLPECGYCPSPVAYKNTVILAVGKPRAEGEGRPDDAEVEKETRSRVEGHALTAFDQGTGKLAWKNMDFAVDYSSPQIFQFDGQDHLAFSSPQGLYAVDPGNGTLLWHYPKNGGIITPVWNGKDTLFYGTADEQKGTALRLTRQGGKIVPEELWCNTKVRCALATPVLIGNHMVCPRSDIVLGVDFETGKRTWAKRGFTAPTVVYGGGKLFLLDEGGMLTLAETSPERLTVLAAHQVTEKYSCTAPTLAGQTLFLRDRKHVMALDVGAVKTE